MQTEEKKKKKKKKREREREREGGGGGEDRQTDRQRGEGCGWHGQAEILTGLARTVLLGTAQGDIKKRITQKKKKGKKRDGRATSVVGEASHESWI